MTNGDKFLNVWPSVDLEFNYNERIVYVNFCHFTPRTAIVVDLDWWEDEYLEDQK